jgi:hypothetical protein
VFDRGAGGSRALAADDLHGFLPRVVEDHRHVAAGAVQVRLDDLQREGRGAAGVEGVAAALENAHGDGRGDPVRGGDDAERAVDLRAGGEARRTHGFLLNP